MRMNRPTHTYEFTKTSDEFTNSYGSLRAFMRLGVEHSLNGTIISFDGEVKTKEDVPAPHLNVTQSVPCTEKLYLE